MSPASSSLLALAAVAAIVIVVRHRDSEREAALKSGLAASERGGEAALRVPHAQGPITLDGDQDDPGWQDAARTGAFRLDNGRRAVPFSEVRITWGDGHLYMSLYASDYDIESHDPPRPGDDVFHVTLSRGEAEYSLEVSPTAAVRAQARSGGAWAPWASGAHASKEWDGTLNAPKDNDEEWVIEMEIPFEALGMKGVRGESLGFVASRCDTTRDSKQVCASWGTEATTGAGRIFLE
jgi:hypothetical protein